MFTFIGCILLQAMFVINKHMLSTITIQHISRVFGLSACPPPSPPHDHHHQRVMHLIISLPSHTPKNTLIERHML